MSIWTSGRDSCLPLLDEKKNDLGLGLSLTIALAFERQRPGHDLDLSSTYLSMYTSVPYKDDVNLPILVNGLLAHTYSFSYTVTLQLQHTKPFLEFLCRSRLSGHYLALVHSPLVRACALSSFSAITHSWQALVFADSVYFLHAPICLRHG